MFSQCSLGSEGTGGLQPSPILFLNIYYAKLCKFMFYFRQIILYFSSSFTMPKDDRMYHSSRCHRGHRCSPSLVKPCCHQGAGYSPHDRGSLSCHHSRDLLHAQLCQGQQSCHFCLEQPASSWRLGRQGPLAQF